MFGAVAEGTYPECGVSDVVALDKEGSLGFGADSPSHHRSVHTG